MEANRLDPQSSRSLGVNSVPEIARRKCQGDGAADIFMTKRQVLKCAPPQGVQKPLCLPSPERLLEGGPATIASMDAGLQAYCVGAGRRKTTNCAQERVFTRFYYTRLLRSTILYICLVTLDHVVFLRLLKFHPNAAPGDINKAEVRRD